MRRNDNRMIYLFLIFKGENVCLSTRYSTTNFSVYIRELYSNNNHLFQTAQGHTIIEILLKSN